MCRREIEEKLPTIHDYFHIAHKSMDDTQSLCDSHPSLVLGQSIKPLEYSLDLTLPQELPCELLYKQID